MQNESARTYAEAPILLLPTSLSSGRGAVRPMPRQRHAEAKTPLKGVCARAREHVSMQDGWVDLRVDVCTCV